MFLCFILPYSGVILPHAGTILVHAISFRCHSVLFQSHYTLFRYIAFRPTKNYYSFSDIHTCQIFLVIEVLQMLQKAKTHAIPLGNQVSQQNLTETTKNRSALTKTPNFQVHSAIFRFIWVSFRLIPARSGIFRYRSCSFCFIPALFCLIPAYSGIFCSVPFMC